MTSALLYKARILLSSYYAYMLEYRAELFLWALSGSLPFILMGVWMKAAASGMFNRTPVQFARYFLAVFIVRQLSIVWVIWNMEQQIVEGKLSPRLLEPLDPIWRHLAEHIAERGARLPFIAVLIALFFLLYREAFWIPHWRTMLIFIPVITSVFLLRFIIQYTLALGSFWIERASALEELWFLPYLFLSGMIAPLDIYPPAAQTIIQWTPFPYLIDFPARLLAGEPVHVLRSVAVMGSWGVALWLCNRLLWRRGLRRYSGMGA